MGFKSPGADWIRTEASDRKRQAQKVLKKLKEERRFKKYSLIKICDHPSTYKEVEIKD